jgi:hypothetical protein
MEDEADGFTDICCLANAAATGNFSDHFTPLSRRSAGTRRPCSRPRSGAIHINASGSIHLPGTGKRANNNNIAALRRRAYDGGTRARPSRHRGGGRRWPGSSSGRSTPRLHGRHADAPGRCGLLLRRGLEALAAILPPQCPLAARQGLSAQSPTVSDPQLLAEAKEQTLSRRRNTRKRALRLHERKTPLAWEPRYGIEP